MGVNIGNWSSAKLDDFTRRVMSGSGFVGRVKQEPLGAFIYLSSSVPNQITGSLFVSGNISASMNISASAFYANGVEVGSGGSGDVTMASDISTDDVIVTTNGTSGKAIQQANASIGTAGQTLVVDADNKSLAVGAAADLSLYHDGTDSHIKNSTGTLIITGSAIFLQGSLVSASCADFTIFNPYEGGNTTLRMISDQGDNSTDHATFTMTNSDVLTIGAKNITIDPDAGGVTTLNGTIAGAAVKDQDDMSSNSATHLATQQSIKAYVDAQVTAQDLDLTTDSGTIAIDLDGETLTIQGTSNEIETSATSNAVTIGLPSNVTLGGNLSVGGHFTTLPLKSETITGDGSGTDVAVAATPITFVYTHGGSSALRVPDGGSFVLRKLIFLALSGSDCVITPDNLAGVTTITLDTVSDRVELLWIPSPGSTWAILSSEGAAFA